MSGVGIPPFRKNGGKEEDCRCAGEEKFLLRTKRVFIMIWQNGKDYPTITEVHSR